MPRLARVLALCAITSAVAGAQQNASRADSTNAGSRSDTSLGTSTLRRGAKAVVAPQQQPTGPTNPRLAPDISAVGDLVADMSPKGSTQDGDCRFCVREVEVATQAVADPYFRGDFFPGISDAEKISIEQAFLTTTSLPSNLEVRLGRCLMPAGKQNTTHRHDLHTVEYPYVIQRFLSTDGLKGTGVYVSKVFSPFGFYQELQVTAVDRFGDPTAGITPPEPVNKELGGMGYSARLRNYVDLSESTNIELSGSAITGKREQPFAGAAPPATAFNARQSVFGRDLTFRWRPLQQDLYRSFIMHPEVMRQVNQVVALAGYAGPSRDFSGGYGFSRYQIGPPSFLGARFDHVEDPTLGGATLNAGSGYLEWFPSEFSKLVAAYERVMPASSTGNPAVNRILFQASFALGPHKPHPF